MLVLGGVLVLAPSTLLGLGLNIRGEAAITNHLIVFAQTLEKYKVVQIFPMSEDRNQEDYIFFGNFILYVEIL